MKRILVMSFGSDPGGIEKSLIEFLKFLKSEGYEVDVYLWRKPGILYKFIPDGVTKLNYRLDPGPLSNVRNFRDFLWYLNLRISKLLKNPVKCFRQFPDGPYDIAISYCQNGYSPYYIINKVIAKKKILFYHHGSYDSTGKVKRLDEFHYLKYDEFITVSHANKSMLENNFPSLRGKIKVINNLIDEENIKILSKESVYMPKGVVTLCTVGRVSPEKGQLLAIETAKMLKQKGISFKWYFVGDGPDREKCEKCVDAYGLRDYCLFVGMQSNPYPYILNSDLYIQPSHTEADPVTIREAKILNKPIIATNIAALQEALCYGKYGILCDENPTSLTDGIISAINGCCPSSYSGSSLNSEIERQLRTILL